MQVPPDYLLPTVTVGGQLGGVSFDGRTVVLTYARQGEGGHSRFLVAEPGKKLTPLTFDGTVAFDAVAPRGSTIYLTRRASATDATRYKVLAYNVSSQTLDPVVHEDRVLGLGRGEAERLDDAGPAAHAHERERRQLDVHALQLA